MNADADIQVWLETLSRVSPRIIVPYVQSPKNAQLRYRLHAVNQGPHGRSELGQGGAITVIADTPAALSRMTLTPRGKDKCHIDLILSEKGHADRTYYFDCPR